MVVRLLAGHLVVHRVVHLLEGHSAVHMVVHLASYMVVQMVVHLTRIRLQVFFYRTGINPYKNIFKLHK